MAAMDRPVPPLPGGRAASPARLPSGLDPRASAVLREILDQERAGLTVNALRDAQPGALDDEHSKLRKWADFVGQKVRERRKAAELTQEQLAEKSGLPQSHISRIEAARLSPSRATLEKIAEALGVSLKELDPSA